MSLVRSRETLGCCRANNESEDSLQRLACLSVGLLRDCESKSDDQQQEFGFHGGVVLPSNVQIFDFTFDVY
jgi:hypothetical protein